MAEEYQAASLNPCDAVPDPPYERPQFDITSYDLVDAVGFVWTAIAAANDPLDLGLHIYSDGRPVCVRSRIASNGDPYRVSWYLRQADIKLIAAKAVEFVKTAKDETVPSPPPAGITSALLAVPADEIPLPKYVCVTDDDWSPAPRPF